MIYWLLFWLPELGSVVVTPPTPVALPFARRSGADLGPAPTFIRRSS